MGVVSSSEDELLSRFQSGFEFGFEELVSRFEGKLYNLCLGLTQCETQSEAVLSDVFCRALDEVQSVVESNMSITNWIFRAAVDEAAERERVRHPELERPETLIIEIENGREAKQDETALLRAAVQNLPYEYRVVYLLHDTMSFPVSTVSEILGVSEIETRAFLHRARLMVCRHLRRFRSVGAEEHDVPAMRPDLGLPEASV